MCCALFPDVHDECCADFWVGRYSILPVGNNAGRQCWSWVRLEEASLVEARLEEARQKAFLLQVTEQERLRIKDPGRMRKRKPSSLWAP